MPCKLFFEHRVIPDIMHAYYAHPVAWNEIGFGGPASPRGYVRMGSTAAIRGKPAEARPGERTAPRARRTNMSADPFAAPRAARGRAPDVFRRGGWVPMREYRDDEPVDFVVVGTGAGGGPLIAGLAEGGFSVIGFDAGPYFRPLEDFASDEREQDKLYWIDERIVDGANPITMGGKNSGKAVGGSTVHFAMVSLRFRPEWFRSRSALGYGADWPLDWREMWEYYGKAEKALSISGPVTYPWGPPRPRYPYRPHELNGAAELLARGAEALGMKWTATPLATVSAPRGLSPPCVYRGFCRFGCSTNAKQSQLVTFIPRALQAGRGNPRSRDGRPHRNGRERTRDRRSLSPRGALALSEGAQRRRRRLCDRDAAVAARLGHRQISRRPRQQLRPGRQEPDDAIQPGGVRHDGAGGALVQGAAVADDHRALELSTIARISPAATAGWRRVRCRWSG